jgi:hypothetical protein
VADPPWAPGVVAAAACAAAGGGGSSLLHPTLATTSAHSAPNTTYLDIASISGM